MTASTTRATIRCGETSPEASERLLDVCRPGLDGLRHDSVWCLGSVGGDAARPAAAQSAKVHINSGSAGVPGNAGKLESERNAALKRAAKAMADLIDARIYCEFAGVKTLHAGQ
jgi:hypothetical protein